MKAEVRDVGPLQKEIEIHLDAGEVGSFIDTMIADFRKRHALPGFRPGKAPDHVVHSRFHDEIERAVLAEFVPRSIQKAFVENKIQPAAPPSVSQIRYRPNEPLSFTVRVDVWPDVELQSYEGMKVDQVVQEVGPEDIDRFLDTLRDRAAEPNPVERESRPTDLVEAELETIDVDGKRIKGTKKEKVVLEMGAENLLPEFRDAVAGIRAKEARDFEVRYPETYREQDLRGQTRRYRLRAISIQEKKLPPLDDQFAKRFDPDLDLEGLRARVRLRLESEKRLAARERLERDIVEHLIRDNPFELPGGAVQSALDRLTQRMREEGSEPDPGEIETSYRPQVERFQRRDFIMEKVAEREQIRVSPDDVEAEITRMANEEKRPIEEVRKDLGDPERFRQFLFERRIFDALIAKVEVREVKAPPSSADPSLAASSAGVGGSPQE